jgi:hypothetical protein
MKMNYGSVTIVLLILAMTALFAGCSDSAKPADSTQSVPATTAAATSALYSAGDIIKNPASTSTTGVLIIRYDPAADSYERAYIYPNNDGSWGYRMDDKTTTVSRANIEKIYTKKVSTIAISSVPVGMPTPVQTATVAAVATATPIKVTATTATTATTSTPTGLAPKVSDIVPAKGTAGTTVSITALEGQNFRTGANVSLVKGSTKIPATNVLVTSPGVITCTIAIPGGSAGGYWDVLVTNPDKQYHQYKTAFYIVEGSGTTTTTTTSATVTATTTIDPIFGTTITSVSPQYGYIGSSPQISITGSNFAYVTNMVLTGPRRIPATTFDRSSLTSGVGTFDLSTAPSGTYTIQAVSVDGTILGTSQSAIFTIS